MYKYGTRRAVFSRQLTIYNLGSPKHLYAYYYQPQPPLTSTDGWKLYDVVKEYERMGVSKTGKWRFTTINKEYEVRGSKRHAAPCLPQKSILPLTHASSSSRQRSATMFSIMQPNIEARQGYQRFPICIGQTR